ncbi:MAG: glycine cleavage system protein GcvH [Actinobacteria bacterium]|nr:glycine cleavage system protein GcvH [Actinomycetota bacterium]MSW24996.1 glycine cleavage system protein GcvH [Actinomycetota bacterium]MSX29214.1 glycine cleavage system protein GcvH [Actinomycetota bacterium]MSX44157.1 glycine cleavage system protein GcvH [Actinomycetota bacterium]MSX97111.1 glycine cleavage system protein GcvH [Actinomycetota bacterium]
MSNIPADLKYTAEHEWVRVIDESTIRFGITDYAQHALGDIVFVSLPSVGDSLTAGATCGEVESTKSVSDIYAPVTGEVLARNDAIETAPDTLNSDPYNNGWIVDVKVSGNASELVAQLLDAAAYQAITTS